VPCNDITEIMEAEIDGEDRLLTYSLNKRTCGQAVGAASLLSEWLGGCKIDDILAVDPVTFLVKHRVEEELERFLTLKHLFALQATLGVLSGRAPGGIADPCAAAEITCDNDHVHIRARILVDLVTEKIRSCGGCKGCGKKAATKGAASRARQS
jgi:hypothetical protein